MAKNTLMSSVYTADQTTVASVKPGQPWSLQLRYKDTTPAAFTFTAAAATDLCTANANGSALGLKGQFTTTTTLPGGLSTSTDYWLIPVTANTFRVASSRANALNGVYVDITSAGTGTHTFTPTNSATRTLQLSISADGTNYVTKYQLDGASEITIAALSVGNSAYADKLYCFSGVQSITTIKVDLDNDDGQSDVSCYLIRGGS